MNEIIIVAKRIINPNQCIASWELPHSVREYYDFWTKQQIAKGINFDKLIIKKPFKARTVGDKSQNHRLNGFIQQIAMHTGMDFDVLKYYFKKKAIKRGYPFETDPEGEAIPLSESKIDTTQAGYLNDEIEQFAGENDITLREE